MDTIKKQRYCPLCKKWVMSERATGMSDGFGCLLTIITAGLFLPIFLLLRFLNSFNRFRCNECGSKTLTKA